MTGKADFTDEEWHLVVQGPPTAGMIVVTAQRGGTFRETFSIAKSYVEARKQHGESALLDEIVSAKPELDRTRYHSPEELRQHGLQHLRDAVALLESKAPAGRRGVPAVYARPREQRRRRPSRARQRRQRERRRARGDHRDRGGARDGRDLTRGRLYARFVPRTTCPAEESDPPPPPRDTP